MDNRVAINDYNSVIFQDLCSWIFHRSSQHTILQCCRRSVTSAEVLDKWDGSTKSNSIGMYS